MRNLVLGLFVSLPLCMFCESMLTLTSCDEIILSRSTTDAVRKVTYAQLQKMLEFLPADEIFSIKVDLPKVAPDSDLTYIALNPSIKKISDGYLVIVRATNFCIGGRIIGPRTNGFNTRNFLLRYTKDFELISQKEILNDLDRGKFPKTPHLGQIDCRHIVDEGDLDTLSMLCVTCDTNRYNVSQISYVALQEDETCVHTAKLTPLLGPDPKRWEKNWLPFIKDDKLCAIYSTDPFVTYTLDKETGTCLEETRYIPAKRLCNSRGSAAPIPFGDGYLYLVHESYNMIYSHRFIYVNKDFQIEKISNPFVFSHVGVEFCCGMTLSHNGKTLLLSYGFEDQEAYIAAVGVERVQSLLRTFDDKS
jgi:hypothetical protein